MNEPATCPGNRRETENETLADVTPSLAAKITRSCDVLYENGDTVGAVCGYGVHPGEDEQGEGYQ